MEEKTAPDQIQENKEIIFEGEHAQSTKIKTEAGATVSLTLQGSRQEKSYQLTHHRAQRVFIIKRGQPGVEEVRDTSDTYAVGRKDVLGYVSEATADQLIEMADTLLTDEGKSHHLLCVGPTSTGKTILTRTLAFLADVPLVEMNFSEDMTSSSLYWRDAIIRDQSGKMVTRRVPSVLVESMRTGTWFLGNELNTVEQDIMPVIFQAIDTGQLILPGGEGGNQVITVHPDFRFIGTMNEGYQGTVPVGEALRARVHVMEFEPQSNEQVQQILGREFFGREYEENPHYQNLIRIATGEFFFSLRDRLQQRAAELGVTLPLANFFTLRKYEDYLRVWLTTDLPLEELTEVLFDDLLECVKAKNLQPQLSETVEKFLDEEVVKGVKTRRQLFADWDRAKNEAVTTERYILLPWEEISKAAPVLVTTEDLSDHHFHLGTQAEKPALESIPNGLEVIIFPNKKKYVVFAGASQKEGRFVGYTRFRIYELTQDREKIAKALAETQLDPSLHEQVIDFYLQHQIELARVYWSFVNESKGQNLNLAMYLREHLPHPLLEELETTLPQESLQKEIIDRIARVSSQQVTDHEEKKAVVRELEAKYHLPVFHPIETAPENLRILETLTRSTYEDLRKIMDLVASGNFVLLIGETRVGKSSLIRTAAFLFGQPLVEIAATGEDTWTRLGEGPRLDPDGLKVDERVVVECATRGIWLLINEGNMLYPGVQAVLNQLRDGRVITLRDGTTRPIHPNFRLFVTANVEQVGGERYAGIKPWNEAFRNRLVGFEIRHIPPEEGMDLIEHYLPGTAESPHRDDISTWLRAVNLPAYERMISPATKGVINWSQVCLLTHEIVQLARSAQTPEEFRKKLQEKYKKFSPTQLSHLIVACPKIVDLGLAELPK